MRKHKGWWPAEPRMEVLVSISIVMFSLLVVACALWLPHDSEDDVIALALICMAAGNVIQTVVEWMLWTTMRRQFDQTRVGLGLKGKWFSLMWKEVAIAIMYVMFAVWIGSPFKPAPMLRLFIYSAGVGSTLSASVFGLYLIRWLREESRKGHRRL